MERLKQRPAAPLLEPPETDELPLKVAPDWDLLVSRAEEMAETIDRHLDFESRLQGRQLTPVLLCQEQRLSLAADLSLT